MNTKRHLEKILKKVEDTYWTKGNLRKKGKKHPFLYCAVGLVELTGDQPGRNYEDSAIGEGRIAERYPEAIRLLALASGEPETTPHGVTRRDVNRVIRYNDSITRAQAKAWIKRAIKLAEEE